MPARAALRIMRQIVIHLALALRAAAEHEVRVLRARDLDRAQRQRHACRGGCRTTPRDRAAAGGRRRTSSRRTAREGSGLQMLLTPRAASTASVASDESCCVPTFMRARGAAPPPCPGRPMAVPSTAAPAARPKLDDPFRPASARLRPCARSIRHPGGRSEPDGRGGPSPLGSPMRVARLHGKGDLRLHDEERPKAGPGETLVRVGAVGLCGSDLHWFAEGGIGGGARRPRLRPRPRVRRRHRRRPPRGRGPGHRLPRVRLLPRRAMRTSARTSSIAGDGAHDGGLGEWVAWPERCLVPLPDALTDADGAMLEPLGIALHALDLAHLRTGARVGVFGCGPIGLLILQIARLAGARLFATDLASAAAPAGGGARAGGGGLRGGGGTRGPRHSRRGRRRRPRRRAGDGGGERGRGRRRGRRPARGADRAGRDPLRAAHVVRGRAPRAARASPSSSPAGWGTSIRARSSS